MRILMINLPYSGHTNPTLGLAKELVERGHFVTVISSFPWKEKVIHLGAHFVPYIDYPENPSKSLEKRLCFRAAYDTAFRIGRDYDVLLYKLLFYLGDTLAKQLQKPAIRQFSMFAWNQTVLDTLIHNEPLWYIFKSNMLRRKLTDTTARGIQIQQRDLLDEIVKQIPKLNIVYTSREFQLFENEFDSRYQFVGPSIYQRGNEITIPFEKMKHPIIYVSLGTVLNFNLIFLKRCIKAFHKQKVTVIISADKHANYLKKKYKSKDIYIYESVPQLEVLKYASLFITHGGMNSVNEAIYYRVPMIRTNMKKHSDYMHASGGISRAADLVEMTILKSLSL